MNDIKCAETQLKKIRDLGVIFSITKFYDMDDSWNPKIYLKGKIEKIIKLNSKIDFYKLHIYEMNDFLAKKLFDTENEALEYIYHTTYWFVSVMDAKEE